MSGRFHPNSNRRLLPFLARVIAVCLLIFATPEAKANWFSDDTATKEENGKEVYVTHIAGVEYHIPIGFFRYQAPVTYLPKNEPKQNETEIFLTAALPDMHEIIASSPESPEVTKRPWGQIVNILITDPKWPSAFEYQLGVTKTTIYGPLQPAGDAFGLHKFTSSKGAFGTVIEDSTLVYSGKKLVEHPTPEDRKGLFEEIYLDSESETPSVYIICNGSSSVPAPGCSEHFADHGLLYKVGYGKDSLKDWLAIKTATIKMMQGFAYSSSNKNTLTKGEYR